MNKIAMLYGVCTSWFLDFGNISKFAMLYSAFSWFLEHEQIRNMLYGVCASVGSYLGHELELIRNVV